MNLAIKVPVCNVIACEDIAANSDEKIYICNPFTGTTEKNIRRFFTYTIIQGIPNGPTTFRIEIANPKGSIVKATEESTVTVEENIIRAKTKWSNMIFSETGEYTVRVLLKCNNEFDVVGTSNIYVM